MYYKTHCIHGVSIKLHCSLAVFCGIINKNVRVLRHRTCMNVDEDVPYLLCPEGCTFSYDPEVRMYTDSVTMIAAAYPTSSTYWLFHCLTVPAF